MSNPVATVLVSTGEVWARSPDGQLRLLSKDSPVYAEDVIVTASGARVELDFSDNQPVTIGAEQEVAMSRDLWLETATSTDEAALYQETLYQETVEALAALELGGDLLEHLEETAAGNAVNGGGISFVQLARIIQEVPEAANFNYQAQNIEQSQLPLDQSRSPNHPPEVDDLHVIGDEDTEITGAISATDPDGDQLTYELLTPPANGTLILDTITGQFTYIPDANYSGADSFVVTVSDTHGNSVNTPVTISVNAVNDAPVTRNLAIETAEDLPVEGQVIAIDVDGDELTYTVATDPANGTVTLDAATGKFIYTPNTNYNGSDSFDVVISDGNGGTTISTVTIEITPVNDAPTTASISVLTDEDIPASGQIIANDIDGDVLNYSIATNPTNGSVTLDATTGKFVYTPKANYNGSDSFDVVISDGKGGTTTSMVAVEITPVNDAPTTASISVITDEDVPASGQIIANDIDGDVLSYSIATNPVNGTVTLDTTTGKFVYTPSANYNGNDSFDVVISDGNGGTTTSTVTVGITPVNDAPTTAPVSIITDEDVPTSGQIIANDIDGDILNYSIATNPANGSVTLDATTGKFVYTPKVNYNGNDSFDVVISDGKGGTTTSTVTIEITPVNDAPTTASISVVADEDVPASGQIIANDIDGDVLSYSIVTNPVNGTVTLDATTGKFVYTPTANYNGSDSFDVVVSDGKGGTTTSTVTIEITPVNDAPTTTAISLITDEDIPASGQIIANDIDGDVLIYSVATNPANGSVTLDAATGKFIYTPNNNYNGNDSFGVVISDGKGGTTTSMVAVEITPVNDAPTTASISVVTDEDVPASGQILANDIDGDVLSYSVATNPANGSVTLDATTGKFIYTPNNNYNGNDSFDVVINDGKGGTTTSTVTIEVTPVNDAPTVAPISITTDEDIPASGQILASDIDGDVLNYSVVTNPTNGTITLDAVTGEFIYTPNANYNGSDSFDVVINDGKGGTTTSTVGIEVTPVNDAPTATAISLITNEDVPAAGQILASDIDGDVLNYSVVTNPTNGTITLDAVTGEFIYTPNANYNGSDSFDVVINDGKGGTTTSTVTVDVTPINDAPTATVISLITNEDVPAAGQILASDIDGDVLNYSVATNPINGAVTLDTSTGKFVYTPKADYNGNDSFEVVISDGKGGTTTSTVTIEVTPVNDAPTVAPISITTDEDIPASGQIIANDIDGDVLNYSIATNPTNGTVTLDTATGKFVYTPTANYNGNDSFDVVISDGKGGTTTSTVTIEITPVNDAPTVAPISITTDEDIPASGQIIANDIDGDVLSYSIETNPTNGTVTLDAVTGEFIYTPNANYNGSDSFDVVISDGKGGTTTSTVAIEVTLVNDAPTATAISLITNEDVPAAGQILASDIDGDVLNYSVVTNPTNGTITLDAVTGEFIYTPNANYNGSDSFEVVISDGKGGTTTSTVTIEVTPVNDAPTATAISLVTDEDTPATGQILASDIDGDVLSYTVETNPTNGTVTLDTATGEFIYTPNANYNGSDSFDVVISDGKGGTTTNTVTVEITPINDAPTTAAISITTDEDVPASGQTIAADIDGDTLNYAIAIDPANGTVTIDAATGKFVYTPNTNYNGSDSFDVVISDGKGGTTTSTVTIEITPVNDAPTTASISVITDEDVPASGQIIANDIDGDVLNYSIATNPANGSVTLDATTGKFIYTPNNNYNGNDSFDVLVSDGKGGITISTVTVEVTPVNVLPSLVTNYLAVTPINAAGLTVDFYNYAEGSDGANLTNLAMARAFINANNPNATFISTALNYAVGDGSLGTGNNLEKWIGSDSGSLVYNNQQSTGDAILHAQGKIFLEAGRHVFRVTADDGYSITIGNNNAGKSDNNQSVTQKTHTPFFTQEAGWHDIEVLYWDQGAKYALQIEVSTDGANFTPLGSPLLGHTQAVQEYRFSAADLLKNAVDPDGDALALTGVTNVVGGSASFDSVTGEIIFVPQAGFSGHHSFDYSVTDGSGVAVTATTYVAIVDNNVVNNGYVQGTLGDDQLHGSSGSDVLDSARGDDILFGNDGDDVLLGGIGNDILLGGAGDDMLLGGADSDILVGGAGADVFAWELSDISSGSVTTDFIHDFNPAEGDALHLADLLQGEESAALTDYLHFAFDGADTTLHISSGGSYGTGGYNAAVTDQIIVLEGVNLVGSLSNADIIDQLKNMGALHVD